uniref:Uncharacterized protein n=2 Tax=Cyprinus carpio TaxID=7962 RepID=A0A8C1H1S5_CYPCA
MDTEELSFLKSNFYMFSACSAPDPDEFFQLLVKSQSQRLDDQRVTLNSLPGMEAFMIKDPKDGNLLKTNFDQFCSMVSRAHV